jgi:adenylate cyclase
MEIALRFANRALERDSNYARAWALVALCQSSLHLRGRSEDTGLEAAKRALGLDPTLAEAYAALGRVLAESGHLEAARESHRESLRLEPSSFDVRHNYGLTCLESGDHRQAIEHLERAAELLETDLLSLSMVAVCYKALGDQAGLVSAAQRALERVQKEIAIRPDNASAIVHGVLALGRLGENERAKSWATRALLIEPDDVMDKFNIACALAHMDEREQALSLLEQCAPRMPPEFVLWIKQDEDLISLRGLPRYQALIDEGETRLAAAKASSNALSC